MTKQNKTNRCSQELVYTLKIKAFEIILQAALPRDNT